MSVRRALILAEEVTGGWWEEGRTGGKSAGFVLFSQEGDAK